MKTLSQRTPAAARQRSEALLEARVCEVFQRLPLLLGFSLDDDLWLADLELHTWPGCDWGDAVYGEVNAALAQLLADAEDQGARELLRGRTFARSLH